LRDDISDLLRDRLVLGQIPPGTRINESSLSTELGVSRTPLRESLLQMEKEGLVVTEPARGFLAAPLSASEVSEVYPVVAVLEGLALRLCPPKDDAAIQLAIETVEALAQATGVDEARALDNRFHHLLVKDCPNARLLSLCDMLKRVTQRYWMLFLAEPRPLRGSVAEHQTIIDALARGDGEAAALRLEEHWRSGMQILLERLDGSPSGAHRLG
jgi:DNA-binding GntR family transcriptional regulator